MKKRQVSLRQLIITLFLGLSLLAGTAPVLASETTSLLQQGNSGTEVLRLQKDLNELGYSTYGIDGVFGPNTYKALIAFQKDQDLTVDGIVGENTRARLNSVLQESRIYVLQAGDNLNAVAIKYGLSVASLMEVNRLTSWVLNPGTRLIIPPPADGSLVYFLKAGDNLNAVAAKYGVSVTELMKANRLISWVLNPGTRLVIPSNKSVSIPSRGGGRYGEMVDWWTVANQVFAIGKIATVTDLDSGLSYQVVRKGGSKHADCQPLTAADTAKMYQAYGGSWSWTRHAILVSVDGRVLAASQNGMPHGGQSIYNNNFPGHFCIHFLNSRTHGTDNLDPNHQAMVRKAAGLSS